MLCVRSNSYSQPEFNNNNIIFSIWRRLLLRAREMWDENKWIFSLYFYLVNLTNLFIARAECVEVKH